MNPHDFQTKKEIATAWGLYRSLHEHASALWERYEEPFLKIIQEEQRIEERPLFPDIDDSTAGDIPF